MNKTWRACTRAYLKRLGKSSLTRLLPTSVLQGIQQTVEHPDQYLKLPFTTFVPFMVSAILWTSRPHSTRLLAGLSANPLLQAVSGIVPVSHQAIADRLRSISHDGLRTLFALLLKEIRDLEGRRLKTGDLLKLFDCTTIERSPLLYGWAANNGDQMAVRLALGVDTQLDSPYCLFDASVTTNDNSIFPTLVHHLKIHETAVLDAGFTRLACFQAIQAKRAFWVARMSAIYHVEVEHTYQLPRRSEQVHEGWVLESDARVLAGLPPADGPLRARRVIWRHPRTGEKWVLWTNQFTWKPKRILQAYLARWRIEVHFRWLKSQLKLDHLPSQDPRGVLAFFLLTILAWLVLRLFYAHYTGRAYRDFSCRDALLTFQQVLLEDFLQDQVNNCLVS